MNAYMMGYSPTEMEIREGGEISATYPRQWWEGDPGFADMTPAERERVAEIAAAVDEEDVEAALADARQWEILAELKRRQRIGGLIIAGLVLLLLLRR